MRILITGHKGFVGQQFVKLLTPQLGEKYTSITGVDLLGTDYYGFDAFDSKAGQDCRSFFKYRSAREFDLIIHLAAIVGGRATIEGEPLSVATDLSIDAEFFNWIVKTGAPNTKVVYFSSSAAYPIELQKAGWNHRLKESDINLAKINNPDFTYGWAKLTGEYLAQFVEKAGMKTYVFRPFSGYGETQALDYPFPSFIKRVVDRMDPFVIWGDGTQVRDFVHIEDVCNSVMHVVENDLATPINIGTGVPTSFNELAEIAFKVEGWRPTKIVHLTDKPAGVMFRCCDPTMFFQAYTPNISLEQGVKRALDYYHHNKK